MSKIRLLQYYLPEDAKNRFSVAHGKTTFGFFIVLVGLGRFELPTSPLSGVRSNQLSYRPEPEAGGAGRDRTGDLLNANQALSQLSYSPCFACPAPALRAENRIRGRLNARPGVQLTGTNQYQSISRRETRSRRTVGSALRRITLSQYTRALSIVLLERR